MPQPANPTPTATNDSAAFVEKKIAHAKALEKERDTLEKRIGAARRQLRDMELTGDLTAEQSDWLRKFYPAKVRGERRSADEIEATRKAKKEARA